MLQLSAIICFLGKMKGTTNVLDNRTSLEKQDKHQNMQFP